MQVCISSDVSGSRKPPFKRDWIGPGAVHLRRPIPFTGGMPRQRLLCDAFVAVVQATTARSATFSSLHDLVEGRDRLSLSKTTGMNDAGRAWSTYKPTFVG